MAEDIKTTDNEVEAKPAAKKKTVKKAPAKKKSASKKKAVKKKSVNKKLAKKKTAPKETVNTASNAAALAKMASASRKAESSKDTDSIKHVQVKAAEGDNTERTTSKDKISEDQITDNRITKYEATGDKTTQNETSSSNTEAAITTQTKTADVAIEADQPKITPAPPPVRQESVNRTSAVFTLAMVTVLAVIVYITYYKLDEELEQATAHNNGDITQVDTITATTEDKAVQKSDMAKSIHAVTPDTETKQPDVNLAQKNTNAMSTDVSESTLTQTKNEMKEQAQTFENKVLERRKKHAELIHQGHETIAHERQLRHEQYRQQRKAYQLARSVRTVNTKEQMQQHQQQMMLTREKISALDEKIKALHEEMNQLTREMYQKR